MTLDDLRAVFESERPHHHDWTVSHFALVLSPTMMALLELYHRHPQARHAVRYQQPTGPPRLRPPDIRPRVLTPFKGLDQKRLASGEKPDDD